jgi:tetratricopeptide (TPR) repeat protein
LGPADTLATDKAESPRVLPTTLLLILLIAATLAAYANAWPNVLVLDDKYFVGTARFSDLSDVPRYFTEDLWAATGGGTGLYRPLLLVSLALDSYLYKDWVAGYHLSSIFLHVLVTLVVFGFVRQLLSMSNGEKASSATQYAFLAALVFGVHPVHTEVVNSIFNRSESLAALGSLAGLWWFLNYLDRHPARAWFGLAIAYFIGLFVKESVVVVPGIALALVLIFSAEGWRGRLRKCLPVFWLLIPLGIYLLLRFQALSPDGAAGSGSLAEVAEIKALTDSGGLPNGRNLLKAAGVWGEALRLLVWPHPLKLSYDASSEFFQWSALVLHLALILAALIACREKRYGLIAGLVFFYIAMLPASRFIGVLGNFPPMTQRYLYFPSVGLAIALAFELRYLGHRYSFSAALAPVMTAFLILTPICWARNAEWASDVVLSESEYRKGGPRRSTLHMLTAAHMEERNFERVIEICDRHDDEQEKFGSFSINCGIAYGRVGRNSEAEQALLNATHQNSTMTSAHAYVARFYLRQGRRDEAREHFELAINKESNPAMRSFRKGELLVMLHRKDREKLIEAREHFEHALRLEPYMAPAQRWLERVDRALDEP